MHTEKLFLYFAIRPNHVFIHFRTIISTIFFLRVKMFSTSLHGIIFCYRILLDQLFFFSYFSFIFYKNQIHGLRRFFIFVNIRKANIFFFHRIPDASCEYNLIIEWIAQKKISFRVFLSVYE